MPDESQSKRVNVLGVGLSAINLKLALEAIAQALAKKNKGYICVTGVHGVMEAQQDERFRQILNRSFLNTPDGMPMVWIGRLNGRREMDRVYGPDLMLLVCEFTRDQGYSHFFYGGGEGVAEDLRRRLEAKFPGIKITGTYTPPFRPLNSDEDREVLGMINRAAPDVLWIGLSTPKQERWMYEYRDRLRVPVLVGVGAAFDICSGRPRQAPQFMREHGLEWLFRLFSEPRRLWRRYLLGGSRFAWNVLLEETGLKKFGVITHVK